MKTDRRTGGPADRRSVLQPPYRRTAVPLILLLSLLACQATTTRPTFLPLPAALQLPLQLTITRATDVVAAALRADSLPVSRVETRDGYLETPWLDTTSLTPTQRRPVGQGVVRIRVWVDPARPGHSIVTLEAVYRELVDPSLPERELDRSLPADHPVAHRLTEILKKLKEEYGEPDQS